MNEHDEKILGQALGRAVDAQSTRETPYHQSRLAARLTGQGRGFGLLRFAAVAATLVVALGAGMWLWQLRGMDPGQVGTTPTPTPSGVAVTPAPTHELVVYVPSDIGLPQAYRISRPADMSTAESRILERMRALEDSGELGLGGANNTFPIRASVASVRVSDDTVTVDYTVPGDDWGDSVSASAGTVALIQQIVYTASEEPGIRRVLITQNGGQEAVVGGHGFVIDRPLEREDVLYYAERGQTGEVAMDGDAIASEASEWIDYSVDEVAPGLVRYVFEVRATAPAPQFWFPRFTARADLVDGQREAQEGKWVIRIGLPDTTMLWPAGEAFHCCPAYFVDQTPLRRITIGPSGNVGEPGVGISLHLDDLRPWRVTVMHDPVRIVVDIGGHPDAIVGGTAVYSPLPNDDVERTFTVSGLARHFEANVIWRLRDQGGNVVAQGFTTASIGTSPIWGHYETQITVPAGIASGSFFTLEVLEESAQDGSDRDVVSIPLRLR